MFAVWPIELEDSASTESSRLAFNVDDEILEVEPAVLKHLRAEGTHGFFTANEAWWKLAFLLFYQQVYLPLDGVYSPELGPFPSETQDIPQDLFSSSFFARREAQFENRSQELEHKGIVEDLEAALRSHRSSPSRILRGIDDNVVEQLRFIARHLHVSAILAICRRLLSDFAENRKGIPDLFLVKENVPVFVEVKSQKDRLSDDQRNWLYWLERQAKVQTAVVVVNHTRAQVARLKSGGKVQGKPITVRFGKSTSKKYGDALEFARSFDSFKALQDHEDGLLHEVAIVTDDVSSVLKMIDYVYRWKGTQIAFENRRIESSALRMPLNCFKEREKVAGGSAWCEREDRSEDKALFGCKQIYLSDYDSYNQSWTEYGYIDSATDEFVLRRDQISEAVLGQFEIMRICPAFKEKRAQRVLDDLPERVRPGETKRWAYEIDGVKWMPTPSGWIGEHGDVDFPGAARATGAAKFTNKELREAQAQRREEERLEREYERSIAKLERQLSNQGRKAQRSGCVVMLISLCLTSAVALCALLFV